MDPAADRLGARGQRQLGRGLQSFLCLFVLVVGIAVLQQMSGSTQTLVRAPPASETRRLVYAGDLPARRRPAEPLAEDPGEGAALSAAASRDTTSTSNETARRSQKDAMRLHSKRYLSWSNIVKETQLAMYKLVKGMCLAPAWQE